MVSHLLYLCAAFLLNDRKKFELTNLLPISGHCTWCNKEVKGIIGRAAATIQSDEVKHRASELETLQCIRQDY